MASAVKKKGSTSPNRANILAKRTSLFSVGLPDIEGVADVVKRARARRDIARVKSEQALRSGPSTSVLKKDSAALRAALKRRQIARISGAGKANPKSRDTDDVFTVDGTRYARTDLYRPTIKDRFGFAKRRVASSSLDWWDSHSKQVVVAAIATVVGFMVYGAWKNAQLERQLGARGRGIPKVPASHPLTQSKARVGWGLPPPSSYGWHGAPAPMWALDGYDQPFVGAPPSPIVTKGHFAGMPRALYPAVRPEDQQPQLRRHHSHRHLVGAPGQPLVESRDYSFTRRPGYNDKNY